MCLRQSDYLDGRQGDPFEQQLARQRRPIELPQREDALAQLNTRSARNVFQRLG